MSNKYKDTLKILFEKAVSQIFIDNGLEYLLFSVGDRYFDKNPIHLNDIQPVNIDGEFWKKGDVYADQIMERIINSIELISLTEEKK